MKGTYCLIISMKKSEKLDIGHLHNMHKYRKGYYVYIGSAMNSLVARINRHLSDEKKLHWHIDYLLKNESSEIRKESNATLQNPYQKTERKFQALDAQTVAAVHI